MFCSLLVYNDYPIIMLFHYHYYTISQTKKAVVTNKCASIVGHFDGHADLAVQCQGHHTSLDKA